MNKRFWVQMLTPGEGGRDPQITWVKLTLTWDKRQIIHSRALPPRGAREARVVNRWTLLQDGRVVHVETEHTIQDMPGAQIGIFKEVWTKAWDGVEFTIPRKLIGETPLEIPAWDVWPHYTHEEVA